MEFGGIVWFVVLRQNRVRPVRSQKQRARVAYRAGARETKDKQSEAATTAGRRPPIFERSFFFNQQQQTSEPLGPQLTDVCHVQQKSRLVFLRALDCHDHS